MASARQMGECAAQYKAINVRAYDVRGLTLVADCFIICAASSEPQFKAIFNGVQDGMRAVDVRPLHTEGSSRGGWLLLDYGDIVFHLFREEAREFYDLDGLWGDAPEVDLESNH